MRLPLVAIALFGLAFGCRDSKTADNGTVVRVTGIPDENPTELAREYQPLVDGLSKSLGARVEYVPVTDYGAAVQALVAGKVDFAWLGGFSHVQARNRSDVVPLVMRDIDREFRSVIIVNVGQSIDEMGALRGKSFAFGSKSSTSGHLMPRYFLAKEFQIDAGRDFAGEPVHSGAHDATVKLVESGKVAGGAVNKQVWQRMLIEKKVDPTKVRVLWETPPYTDYVWTARRAVPEERRQRFANFFLGLNPEAQADAPILKRMGAQKYVTASPSDFDVIEDIARKTGLLKDR